MPIEFASLDALPATGSLVLLATADGRMGEVGTTLDRKANGTLSRALAMAGSRFKSSWLEIVCPSGLQFDRILLAAIDERIEAKPNDLEAAGGRIATRLGAIGIDAAAVVVERIDAGLDASGVAALLGLGAELRNYRFDRYQASRDDDSEEPRQGPVRLTFHLQDPAAAAKEWQVKAAVVDGVLHARDLVSEPANVLTPQKFAQECKNLEGALGINVEILDREALESLGMQALLGVAKGSAEPPYVVVMRWWGRDDGELPVALVGKGVCFDTGGISIKPSAGMEEMKWDMAGAAAVFGAMKALAGRKAACNVVAVLGLVENMPSGSAQRPGDVVKAMSGKTIEVINTDAEGRLVLADALHYAIDRFKPRLVIDVATLTGAVIVALGHERAGLFANDEDLAKALIDAGEAVNERVWRLPLGRDYAKHVKSDIADIKNVGRAREAGATAGAVFLQQFVGDLPWAHIDIAGVAWSKRDLPLAAKGATAFGVRLLDRFVAAWCERQAS